MLPDYLFHLLSAGAGFDYWPCASFHRSIEMSRLIIIKRIWGIRLSRRRYHGASGGISGIMKCCAIKSLPDDWNAELKKFRAHNLWLRERKTIYGRFQADDYIILICAVNVTQAFDKAAIIAHDSTISVVSSWAFTSFIYVMSRRMLFHCDDAINLDRSMETNKFRRLLIYEK